MTDLPYPDDPGRTHWDGCYRERGHHNCAVAKIDQLEEELRKLARKCQCPCGCDRPASTMWHGIDVCETCA